MHVNWVANCARRKVNRLTQPEFSKQRDIIAQALRQIDAGTGKPTVETFDKMAGETGVIDNVLIVSFKEL